MIKEKELECLHKWEDDHMLPWYVPASKPAINSGQGRQEGQDKNHFLGKDFLLRKTRERGQTRPTRKVQTLERIKSIKNRWMRLRTD